MITRKPQTAGRDVFADIGEREIGARRGRLQDMPPPTLPRKVPATGVSDPGAAFKPLPKLDTAEKLEAELERQR